MKKKFNFDKRHITLSIILTFLWQGLICYHNIFIDMSDHSDYNLKLNVVISLILSMILISFKNGTLKSIGFGIILGTLLSVIVFFVTLFFGLMFAFSNNNSMYKDF